MTEIEKERYFLRFLKKNNLYYRYKNYSKKCWEKDLIDMSYKIDLIVRGFTWADTKEGFDFWNCINTKFIVKFYIENETNHRGYLNAEDVKLLWTQYEISVNELNQINQKIKWK